MAKRQRDYKAEYQRRLALGKSKGLTVQQARRGARKATAEQARLGLTPAQVQRVRKERARPADKHGHRTLMFPDLDSALAYARTELGPLESSMVKGYGQVPADSKYELVTRTGKAYASLSTRALPSGYSPGREAAIRAEASRVFTSTDRVYLVVWPFDQRPTR